MKGKAMLFLIMLVLAALLPFAAVKCSYSDVSNGNSASTSDTLSTESDKEGQNDSELLCALVAAEYNEDYDSETVKAVAVILNNNYKVNPDSFNLDDTSQCLYEEDANNSVKENYSEIEEAVNSVKEIKITCNEKSVYIPFSQTSNGHTYAGTENTYFVAVASPWDCFNSSCDENEECIGVSLNGIDILCKSGCNYKEALEWYLPLFNIA